MLLGGVARLSAQLSPDLESTYLQAWIRGVPVVSFFDPDGVIRREGLGYAAASLDEMASAAHRLTTDPQA
jgi:hypothetical protein